MRLSATMLSRASGNTPAGVPESAANLSLQWAASDALRVGGALRYVGKRYSDNTDRLEIDSYLQATSSPAWR